MDNAQKAIMIGVGLFITIIVIAAVMLITGMGQDLLNSGTNQLSSVTSGMNSALYEQLLNTHGTKISKSSAKQFVSQYGGLSGVTITINNTDGTNATVSASSLATFDANSTIINNFYKVSAPPPANGVYTVTLTGSAS